MCFSRTRLKTPLIALALLLPMLVDVRSAPAASSDEVDLALVLAVDISYSMDLEEQSLQRSGYIEGLRSPAVINAIRRGVFGRVAVLYMEWAGSMTQQVIVPWQVIDSEEGAETFASKLEHMPIRRGYRTSISAGIDNALKLLDEAPVTATRRAIDVSGDGANNQGRAVTEARDEAVAKGVTINGLPIMIKQTGFMDVKDIDNYYRDCVIGGPGAFIVPVRERGQFREAIVNKLVLEIAGSVLPDATVQRAQMVPCLAGERVFGG
jgi:hypothetical protein